MMNVSELRSRLESAGIDPTYYCLNGGEHEGRLILEKVEGGWHVYFFERGARWDEQTFPTEVEACQYFHEQAMRGLLD